jgi:two-component system, OmpR family, response regulator VicR
MHKIMIVDDEHDLVNGLSMSFKKEGYDVIEAFDGNTALKLALQENPHLILLDVAMPGMSGLMVCQALRTKEVDTRIIMLSAKSDEVDKVVGLEIGADDYITKPFSLRELHALVRARLRYREPAACEFVPRYSFDDIAIDFDKLVATRDGTPLDLTAREFEILQFLIKYRGQVVTRERILDKIWGHNSYSTPRTIDNHILRVRKKVEPDPSKPRYILSAYGGGYKFVG